jgi:hypothetical protein
MGYYDCNDDSSIADWINTYIEGFDVRNFLEPAILLCQSKPKDHRLLLLPAVLLCEEMALFRVLIATMQYRIHH